MRASMHPSTQIPVLPNRYGNIGMSKPYGLELNLGLLMLDLDKNDNDFQKQWRILLADEAQSNVTYKSSTLLLVLHMIEASAIDPVIVWPSIQPMGQLLNLQVNHFCCCILTSAQTDSYVYVLSTGAEHTDTDCIFSQHRNMLSTTDAVLSVSTKNSSLQILDISAKSL